MDPCNPSITLSISSHIFFAWDPGVFTTLVIFSCSASTFAEPRAAPQMICRLAAAPLRSPRTLAALQLLSFHKFFTRQPAKQLLGFFSFFFSSLRESHIKGGGSDFIHGASHMRKLSDLTSIQKPPQLRMPPTGEGDARA